MMDNVIQLFDPHIPEDAVFGILIVFCIILIGGLFVVRNTRRVQSYLFGCVLVEYYFLTLCSTVFCRSLLPEYKINMIPFWSYKAIYDGVETFGPSALYMNIVLFVPIGLLLSGIFRTKSTYNTIKYGFLLSFIIELLQLLLKRGLCEFDDLMHNTLGCLIGMLMYKVLVIMTNKIKNAHTRNT